MRWLILLAMVSACANSSNSNPNACVTQAECTNPAKPYCVAGSCEACDGASTCTAAAPVCAATTQACTGCTGDGDCSLYPATTHCDSADGACVGCVASSQCDTATPFCDPMTRMCRACSADDECASGACDADVGTCVAAATILFASTTGSATSGCGKADPCTFDHAFTLVSPTKNLIKLAAGTYSTVGVVTAAQDLAIHGAGATLTGAIQINGEAVVRIRGLALTGDGSLYCTPLSTTSPLPTFDLDQTSFDTSGASSASPIAFQANACRLNIRRSTFKTPQAGALALYMNGRVGNTAIAKLDRCSFEGGEPAIGLYNSEVIHISNSLFYGTTTTWNALAYDSTATGTVAFSTFINWSWLSGNGGPVRFIGSNNLFYDPLHNNTNTLTGTKAEHHYTLAYPQALYPNGMNNLYDLGTMTTPNPMLKDPANRDFHLITGSPAIDTADPLASDPIDYAGTARPQGPRRDIGAYEYK